jgi:undecaprenyl pyrophosphate synthase
VMRVRVTFDVLTDGLSTEIRCLSAETVLIRLTGSGGRPEKAAQNCYEAAENRKTDENFVTVFRVYYDGEPVIETSIRNPIVEQTDYKHKKCIIH